MTPSKFDHVRNAKRKRRSNKEKQIHSQETTRKEDSENASRTKRPTTLTGSEQKHFFK
jgi:hypothetical protein